jgi:hypothetical protein
MESLKQLGLDFQTQLLEDGRLTIDIRGLEVQGRPRQVLVVLPSDFPSAGPEFLENEAGSWLRMDIDPTQVNRHDSPCLVSMLGTVGPA